MGLGNAKERCGYFDGGFKREREKKRIDWRWKKVAT